MSIFPLFNASFIGFILLSLFNWKVNLNSIILLCLVVSIIMYSCEVLLVQGIGMFKYESAFWLFIFSEMMIFGTLLTCCLYFDSWHYVNLSSPLEIPFLGCFVLLGSSITITAFHHLFGWRHAWVLLLMTVVLGLGFVIFQLVEMEEIFINIFDTSFHASSLCTVGLHFSHVLLGVVGLFVTLIIGYLNVGYYRCTVLTWYWHFVDYVWLFVYTFVYVCYYWYVINTNNLWFCSIHRFHVYR